MPGTYHIIHDRSRWISRPAPKYGARRRQKTRMEEMVEAICGKFIPANKDNCCNISVADPNWKRDWCHECVGAVQWSKHAQTLWRKKGIDVMLPQPSPPTPP